MLDSITYRIPGSSYTVGGLAFFKDTKSVIRKGYSSVRKIADTKLLSSGGAEYWPEISLVTSKSAKKSVRQEYLEIKGSVSKVLFGTNGYESDESDLDAYVLKISNLLKMVHVAVSPQELKTAAVSKAEFSKIIELSSVCTVVECLEKLKDFNYNPKSEFTDRDYKGGGRHLKFFNKSQSLTLYDKLPEMLAANSTVQGNVFLTSYQGKELLKIEVSLQKQQAVRGEMEGFLKSFQQGSKKDYYLADFFNNDLSKFLILKKMDQVFSEECVKFVSLGGKNDRDLRDFLVKHCTSFVDQTLMYYMVSLVKQIGLYGSLETLKRAMSRSRFYAHKKQMIELLAKLPMPNDRRTNIIRYIFSELNKFQCIRPLPAPQTMSTFNLTI